MGFSKPLCPVQKLIGCAVWMLQGQSFSMHDWHRDFKKWLNSDTVLTGGIVLVSRACAPLDEKYPLSLYPCWFMMFKSGQSSTFKES